MRTIALLFISALTAFAGDTIVVVNPVSGGVTVPTPDAHYSMDLDGGTGTTVTADIGDNCSFNGSPTWVSDDAGGDALDFSGSNQSLNCGTNHDGLNDFAVGACIQADTSGSSNGLGNIVVKYGVSPSWFLRMNDFNGTVDAFDGSVLNSSAQEDRFRSPVGSSTACVDGATWCHVAIVFANGTSMNTIATIYINGSAVTTTQTSDFTGTRISDSTFTLGIGGQSGTGFFFDGTIDEVKLWYTDIPDAAEIAAEASPCSARNP